MQDPHCSCCGRLFRVPCVREARASAQCGFMSSRLLPQGRSPYRIAEMVQDVVELIPALGHSKCVLVRVCQQNTHNNPKQETLVNSSLVCAA